MLIEKERGSIKGGQISRLPAGQQGRADMPRDRDSRGQARSHLLRGKEGFLYVNRRVQYPSGEGIAAEDPRLGQTLFPDQVLLPIITYQ